MKKALFAMAAALGALVAIKEVAEAPLFPSIAPAQPTTQPAPPLDEAPVLISDDEAAKEARRERMRELGRKGGKKRVENARKKKGATDGGTPA